jgi:glycosyltransferase involved in cell wall biosynthesis
MRIAYLSAGAGSLICGACTHDFLIATSLRRLRHEVHVLPMYTPVRTDRGDIHPDGSVYLGGISSYIRAHYPRLGSAVRYLRPLLDSAPLIKLATRRVVATDPRQLGRMTASVLEGAQGPHGREMRRLTEHLRRLRPDVVLLANSLFAPLATLLAELKTPTFASFQGEDCFLLELPEPHRSHCIDLLRRHAADLAQVICPSRASAQQAGILLQLPAERLPVIAAPVDHTTYGRNAAPPSQPLTIGHLSVLRPAKGLDVLLRAMPAVADQVAARLRLLVGGQIVDAAFAREMRKLAASLPHHVEVHFLGELTLEQKRQMLHACHLLCLPSRIQETRALAALEAMAAGVPVIASNHGSFPELLAGGAGWLFEPGDVRALTELLAHILLQPELISSASARAAEHARAQHNPDRFGAQLEELLLAGSRVAS